MNKYKRENNLKRLTLIYWHDTIYPLYGDAVETNGGMKKVEEVSVN